MEIVTGLEPVIRGLQPRAFPTWLHDHMVSAVRVELTLLVPETSVLPLDETEIWRL